MRLDAMQTSTYLVKKHLAINEKESINLLE